MSSIFFSWKFSHVAYDVEDLYVITRIHSRLYDVGIVSSMWFDHRYK